MNWGMGEVPFYAKAPHPSPAVRLGWMRGLMMQWETATGPDYALTVEGADAVGADADDADGDLELAFEEF